MANVLKKFIGAGAILAMLMTPAAAGGFFGEGGLIRGDVGNFIGDYIESPILTPALRTVTVLGGATVGAELGGPAGAIVGAVVGQAINEAAGPGQPAQQQTAAVETGRTCSTTAIGSWPLDNPLPLGTACIVKLQNGSEVSGTATN